MTAIPAQAPARIPPRAPARRKTAGRAATHVFLFTVAVVWLVPLLWAVYTSLRPYDETSKYGYFSWPHSLTFSNFSDAWSQADIPKYFLNSIIVTLPSVLIALVLASFVAFVLSRFHSRFNIPLLILFTAGNLLPQQVIIIPLYRLYLSIHLPGWLSDSGLMYNSYFGLIVINVTFQLGFCVFVLSNYMKTIPAEITEAGLIDGASAWGRYRHLTLPLCRPALAALATLLTTWIYNDFFWATVLIEDGGKRPITSALANLQGVYFTNNNLLAAGALITAIPTLVVYLLLQRHFIAGLALGSTKG